MQNYLLVKTVSRFRETVKTAKTVDLHEQSAASPKQTFYLKERVQSQTALRAEYFFWKQNTMNQTTFGPSNKVMSPGVWISHATTFIKSMRRVTGNSTHTWFRAASSSSIGNKAGHTIILLNYFALTPVMFYTETWVWRQLKGPHSTLLLTLANMDQICWHISGRGLGRLIKGAVEDPREKLQRGKGETR